jgi:hypothetical protein
MNFSFIFFFCEKRKRKRDGYQEGISERVRANKKKQTHTHAQYTQLLRKEKSQHQKYKSQCFGHRSSFLHHTYTG